MKFKFTEIPDFLEYFLIEGACNLETLTGKSLKELWPDMFEVEGPPKEWDLKVLMNDVEIPADKVFEQIDSQIDEFVAKKAVALIKEKYNDVNDLVYDLEQLIIGRIQKDYPNFKIDDEED